MDYSVEEQSPTSPFLLLVAFDKCFIITTEANQNEEAKEKHTWDRLDSPL